MKKIATLLVLGLTKMSIASGQQPVSVTPKAAEITVYLSGAEIRFKETVSLKRGDNTVVFKGLSASLVGNSVQVAIGNNADILSVSTQPRQLLPEEIDPALKVKKDSIAALEDRIVWLKNQVDAYDMEKKTLMQNQHIGGAQTGVALAELTKAADFFRERTLKINNALTALDKKLKLLNDRLLQLQNDLNSRQREINLTRYNVEVIVNSKADQPVDFMVRHLVSDAAWEASYDIVATELNKPVTLKYKALVYNHTGIDWHDVKLSMSTGDISLNATRPYLTAWTLNYTSGANEGFINTRAQNVLRYDSVSGGAGATEEKAVSELNTSFEIAQRHSIRAGDQPYRIDLREETLQASFEYLTVPKLELSAFLIAKLTGWEKLNLIDGTANVYFGDTFIGESSINTRLIGDTLELSLGRDNQVVVSRTKIEDKGSTPLLGAKRSESFVYEIQLRNNRKVPVFIRVQDQVPISQENDITVDVAETSGAALDAPSGRLQWIKNLAPGEATRYKIAFAVRYPKNRTVNIRKSRLVRTPRYRN
jgi:uncharacterized protein (TIGR02231 family)